MNVMIHNAQLVAGVGQNSWMFAVEVDREDGTAPQMVAMVFPEDTIEWRTAEYGLDDLSDDELWDLVIREALTPTSTEEVQGRLAKPLTDRRQEYLDKHRGSGLKKRAKGARRPRVNETGQPLKAAGPRERVLVDSDLDDPMETVKKHTPRRGEHVRARREVFEDLRQRMIEGVTVPAVDDVVLSQSKQVAARRAAREQRKQER